MRLVKVTQISCQSWPVCNHPLIQFFSGLVKSITPDDPARTDPDVAAEEPLQRSYRQVELSLNVINFGHLPVSSYVFDDLIDLYYPLVSFRAPAEEESFGKFNPLLVV
jgi:hypothetical protein